ncbi:MAG: glutathione S-transferase family protein [Gammaproteobacteria bacterium]|nr:glutathione S-transferase family protein [Gammaproteobacteria bacterium]
MIDLYTWATPNGRKVSIALEEFGLDYQVHAVDITRGDQHDPQFLEISPNGKIPAVVDREEGRNLMESGAILMYLAEKYDGFQGDDRWQTLEWLMMQMGGVGPMLGQAHHFLRFNPGKAPYAEERYAAEAKRLYSVLDKRLRDREYLSGSYSIADMATWPWISRYEWQGINWVDHPHLLRWYLAVAERPAVQRGYNVPKFVNEIPIP